MKKPEEVVSYLIEIKSDIMRTYQKATLQKEKSFFESRYLFISEVILKVKERIAESK